MIKQDVTDILKKIKLKMKKHASIILTEILDMLVLPINTTASITTNPSHVQPPQWAVLDVIWAVAHMQLAER